MDCCISYNTSSFSKSLPFAVKVVPFAFSISSLAGYNRRPGTVSSPINRTPAFVVASSHCEFSSFNTPLDPRSPAGKFLSGVLQNDRKNFHYAVAQQLEQLVSDRDQALARFSFSLGSTHACLYRALSVNNKASHLRRSLSPTTSPTFAPPLPQGKSLINNYKIDKLVRDKPWAKRDAVQILVTKFVSYDVNLDAPSGTDTDIRWACSCTSGNFLTKYYNHGQSGGDRRMAELNEQESQTAIEDVMYMLILYKFSEIRVHLVPRLSECIYNGRLEILPSKDWELESIHSLEVLDLIKEHLGSVIGWKADSNVKDNWATTKIPKLHLCRVYAASILYGYFLKSASTRHRLELSLAAVSYDLQPKSRSHRSLSDFWSYGLNLAFGRVRNKYVTAVGQASCSQVKGLEKLSSYVMGFDPEVLQMCAKPKSKEAMNLIEMQSCALFGDGKSGLLESDEVISTSLASLKRFVLEAVAFGSFLWDSEEYVETVYSLKEN